MLTGHHDNDDANVQPSAPLVASSSEGISPLLQHPQQRSHAMPLHQQQLQEQVVGRRRQPFGGWSGSSTEDRVLQNNVQSSQIDISYSFPSPLINNNSRRLSNDGDDGKNTNMKKKKAGQDSWNERFEELCQFVKENGHTW